MIQLISIIVCMLIFLSYLKFKQKATKKFANSILFLVIEREYNKWYSKDNNGSYINKKTVSVFEVDQAIFKLKRQFLNEGITREQLLAYIDFLSKNTSKKNNIIGILIGVLSYLGTKTFLKELLPDWSSISSVSAFATLISEHFTKYKNEIYIIFYIILLLIYILLLLYFMYKMINIDNLHKSSQELFVLKRVNEIWNFTRVKQSVTKKQASDIAEHNNFKVVFTKLEPSKTRFDKELENAIGNTVFDNYQFILHLIKIDCINFEFIKEWLLGMIFPIIFSLGSVFLGSKSTTSTDVISHIIILSCSLVFLVGFFLVYSTLIDKFQGETGLSKDEIKIMKNTDGKNYKLSIELRKNIKKRSWLSIGVILLATLVLRIVLHSQIKVRPTFSFKDIAFFWPIDLVILLLVIISSFSIFMVGRKVKKLSN